MHEVDAGCVKIVAVSQMQSPFLVGLASGFEMDYKLWPSFAAYLYCCMGQLY